MTTNKDENVIGDYDGVLLALRVLHDGEHVFHNFAIGSELSSSLDLFCHWCSHCLPH